jgi:hypothetical protein
MRLPHWFGETVVTHDTTLDELPSWLPAFARQPVPHNRFRDQISRSLAGETEPLVVGLVSRRYALVQHADVVSAVAAALRRIDLEAADVPVHLQLSEYGSRMALRATLPDAYAFSGGDGHRMALTFECLNSVDGTVPLFAALGWFRFICGNGLIVGTTAASIRQRHSPSLCLEEFHAVLSGGIEAAVFERERLADWKATPVDEEQLATWVDGPLASSWGPSAAARAYAVATTGYDGKPEALRRPPHARHVSRDTAVAGTVPPCRDVYAVAQVLAWLAARRANVAERLRWRAEMPALMGALVTRC